MRRAIASLAAMLLLLSAAGPSVAMASNGAAAQFKITFDDVSCSGAHVVNKVSVKDSETCFFPTGQGNMTAGTFQGNPTGMNPWGFVSGWHSDYNGLASTSWTITSVDNGDGSFTAYIVAYY